jgi:hypothetical protein
VGLFQQISLEAKTRELRFLVIGALAINFHGCSRANGVDVRSEKVRQLFQKYGTLELYEKVCRTCAG